MTAKRFARIAVLAAALAAGHTAAAARPAIVLLPAEPVSLDPTFTRSDANLILTIHETLFRLDDGGKVVPAIAESIENVDPLNWTIRIRRGLEFHNGEPINADAVVFTFDRAKKLQAAGKGDLTFALGALRYERVEKIDDHAVRIAMGRPDLFKAFTEEFDPSKWQRMCFEAEAYAAEQAPVIGCPPSRTSRRLGPPRLHGPADGRLYLNLVLKGIR